MTDKDLKSMKERLHAQRAWGKWNTSSLSNQISRLEQSRKPEWRKQAEQGGINGAIVFFSLAFWAIMLAPILQLLVSK